MSQSKMISVPQIARMDDIRKTSTSIKEKKRSKLTRVVRKWTNEEDERMALLVREHGSKHWGLIASKLGGRTGKQCRERWHNQLDPFIKKDPWTQEEEKILMVRHTTNVGIMLFCRIVSQKQRNLACLLYRRLSMLSMAISGPK
mmetsp:Transcript_35906/g.83746  ORF Transcript_35906/g.83746 Transcript_35906/m.83746 type:complete len:144 (-) Transcript_35906:1063-1494(-)